MKRIVFLMPTTGQTPRGGFKIIYQYANLLAKDGNQIDIIYPVYFKIKTTRFLQVARYCKLLFRYLFFYINRGYHARWFQFSEGIKEKLVFSLSSVAQGYDCYIGTGSITAQYLSSICEPNDKKFYFIQGYEPWLMTEQMLLETYRLPVTKIVISKWLSDTLLTQGIPSIIVPNGFSEKEFNLTIPIEEKDRFVISMLYHTLPSKNVELGFKALELVHKKYNNVKVLLFGVYDCPDNLPEWYDYYQSPSLEEHSMINNKAAIYVGTSDSEGWGLTVGEAMCCGQAVCCTDNKGYLEMVKHQENALISPVGDVERLASNIIALIGDNELRIAIAKQGYMDIGAFSVENSYQKFKKIVLG